MPWAGHLYIGEKVRNTTDVIRVFQKLGKSLDNDTKIQDLHKFTTKISVEYMGETFVETISFQQETEEGVRWPLDPDEQYTDAIVGFALTSRYQPAILDYVYEHGRPEPFEVDVVGMTEILKSVQTIWPEARVLIWTNYF